MPTKLVGFLVTLLAEPFGGQYFEDREGMGQPVRIKYFQGSGEASVVEE